MPRALAPPPNSGPPTLLPPPLAAEWGLWACRPSSPISRSLVACSCPFISSSRPLVSAIWAPTSLRPSLHLPSSDGSSLASRWFNICRCCACCSREAMRALALPSFRSHRRERTWGDGLPLAAAELALQMPALRFQQVDCLRRGRLAEGTCVHALLALQGCILACHRLLTLRPQHGQLPALRLTLLELLWCQANRGLKRLKPPLVAVGGGAVQSLSASGDGFTQCRRRRRGNATGSSTKVCWGRRRPGGAMGALRRLGG